MEIEKIVKHLEVLRRNGQIIKWHYTFSHRDDACWFQVEIAKIVDDVSEFGGFYTTDIQNAKDIEKLLF